MLTATDFAICVNILTELPVIDEKMYSMKTVATTSSKMRILVKQKLLCRRDILKSWKVQDWRRVVDYF